MISLEWDEIVGERGAELSGAVCCDFEQWSGGSEHPRERGAEILIAQLRSHALVGCGAGWMVTSTGGLRVQYPRLFQLGPVHAEQCSQSRCH